MKKHLKRISKKRSKKVKKKCTKGGKSWRKRITSLFRRKKKSTIPSYLLPQTQSQIREEMERQERERIVVPTFLDYNSTRQDTRVSQRDTLV
jgi:hypothetical protein